MCRYFLRTHMSMHTHIQHNASPVRKAHRHVLGSAIASNHIAFMILFSSLGPDPVKVPLQRYPQGIRPLGKHCLSRFLGALHRWGNCSANRNARSVLGAFRTTDYPFILGVPCLQTLQAVPFISDGWMWPRARMPQASQGVDPALMGEQEPSRRTLPFGGRFQHMYDCQLGLTSTCHPTYL